MKYELKKYSTGGLIGTGFNLLVDNFFILILLSLIAGIPSYFTLLGINIPILNTTGFPGLFLLLIFSSVFVTVCTGLTIEIVAKRYLGERITFHEYSRSLYEIFFPLLLLSFLKAVLTGIGYFLVVPGILFSLGFSVAEHVLVIERKKVIESLKRSWDLTKGKKAGIFGLSFLLFLILIPIIFIVIFLSTFIFSMTENFRIIAPQVSMQFLMLLIRPFFSCVFTLLYFNLRIEKEGFKLEYLVKRFSSEYEEGEEISNEHIE
jgi:hypothetical protein